jgi:hypothetical protein
MSFFDQEGTVHIRIVIDDPERGVGLATARDQAAVALLEDVQRQRRPGE